jgi:hypothetical protein
MLEDINSLCANLHCSSSHIYWSRNMFGPDILENNETS